MDGPSRPPYWLDLDNGPVLGIGPDPKSERDFRRLRFSFFRQELALIEPLLKHQGPTIVRIVELHWRDFAVFVSLSSRTNTRQGLALVRCIRPVG